MGSYKDLWVFWRGICHKVYEIILSDDLSLAFSFQLNVKKVYTKVQDWLIAADSLQRDVPPHDGVMKRWVKLVKDFSNIINVMKELSNPALKVRLNRSPLTYKNEMFWLNHYKRLH